MKLPGLYVPLDVNYVSDEGIRRAGADAELLFVRGLAYAKRTKSDGFLPDYDMPVIAVGLPEVEARVKALVAWELWDEEDDGWRIRSWDRWNPPGEEEERARKRALAADRKRRQRERQAAEESAAETPEGDKEEGATEQPPLALVPEEGQLPLPENVTRDVTRDSHASHAPKRREEKRTNTPRVTRGSDKGFEIGSDQDSDFVEFWKAYPRSVGKPSGRKAWKKAIKAGHEAALIIAAARVYANDPKRKTKDIEYTPHPSRWLNDERFNDIAPLGQTGTEPRRNVRNEWMANR